MILSFFPNHAKGFSNVETERLFDRFYTVNHAKGSADLGLSISGNLMESMDGTIEAVYELGILRIIVTLPMI